VNRFRGQPLPPTGGCRQPDQPLEQFVSTTKKVLTMKTRELPGREQVPLFKEEIKKRRISAHVAYVEKLRYFCSEQCLTCTDPHEEFFWAKLGTELADIEFKMVRTGTSSG
jgi:hypothetical protein